MGMREDSIELEGSDYERKLYDLKSGLTIKQFLVQDAAGRWSFAAVRPPVGEGAFIERMPNGECRLWSNREADETSYQRV